MSRLKFPPKSLEALTVRLNEFNRYCQTLSTDAITRLTYQPLLTFVADFEAPSVHIKKSRVWALRQFYHFLKLNQIVDNNLATQIPYPKIAKKVPKYLTMTEFNRILRHFAAQANTSSGLRNLIAIMLFGFLGLRLRSVLNLNVEDVDLRATLIRVREKGNVQRCSRYRISSVKH